MPQRGCLGRDLHRVRSSHSTQGAKFGSHFISIHFIRDSIPGAPFSLLRHVCCEGSHKPSASGAGPAGGRRLLTMPTRLGGCGASALLLNLASP
jgi:hypothetical protein